MKAYATSSQYGVIPHAERLKGRLRRDEKEPEKPTKMGK
jgi:hypothetical protein